jgi:hypothetical protein
MFGNKAGIKRKNSQAYLMKIGYAIWMEGRGDKYAESRDRVNSPKRAKR